MGNDEIKSTVLKELQALLRQCEELESKETGFTATNAITYKIEIARQMVALTGGGWLPSEPPPDRD